MLLYRTGNKLILAAPSRGKGNVTRVLSHAGKRTWGGTVGWEKKEKGPRGECHFVLIVYQFLVSLSLVVVVVSVVSCHLFTAETLTKTASHSVFRTK